MQALSKQVHASALGLFLDRYAYWILHSIKMVS